MVARDITPSLLAVKRRPLLRRVGQRSAPDASCMHLLYSDLRRGQCESKPLTRRELIVWCAFQQFSAQIRLELSSSLSKRRARCERCGAHEANQRVRCPYGLDPHLEFRHVPPGRAQRVARSTPFGGIGIAQLETCPPIGNIDEYP